MHRPVSPLLHDYKSTARPGPKKPKALHWFAVGMGLPLVGIGFLLLQKSAEGTVTTPKIERFVETTTDVDPVSMPTPEIHPDPVDDIVVATSSQPAPPPVVADAFHPPMLLPAEDLYSRIDFTISKGDTLDRLFRKNKIDLGHLAAIIKLPEARDHLRLLKPGDQFQIRHDGGKLVSLYRELDLTRSLLVAREDDGFSAKIIDRPIEKRKRLAYGRIDSSLFESAASAGLNDKLIMNLAGIFAWDIDFVLDIRTDDNYYILFEEIWQDGAYVTDGEIVAAEFNNNGRTFQAIRYLDHDGRSDYFTPEGRSVRKAFIRAPVDFTRISSSFNPNRKHPILNTIRAHQGVDYAAPKGTPIQAAGDGKVIFRGVKGGYGNAVILQHGGNITTLYAHMSRFANSARVGQRVRQGQTIGYVGSSGLATAAHLHYEYRLNGVHRNPRTVPLPQADPIREELKQDFLASAEPILDELLQYKRTQIASLSLD